VVSDEYFKIKTPLGIIIRTTKAYWQMIVTIKHPSIAKYEAKVKESLKDPDEVRRSIKDLRVHLYYKKIGKLNVCAVTDHIDKKNGYMITAYLTDRIKEGEVVYVKDQNVL